jgi:hypothetical protein
MSSENLLTQIANVCERAAEGDLEARIVPLPDESEFRRMCAAINHLLDMVDSYVRESQAVLEYCGRHEYYRPILVRGLHGAYGGAAAIINRAASEMQASYEQLQGAEAKRKKLMDEVSSSTQSVAAACEELTATSSEISQQLKRSASLTDEAVTQAFKAKETSSSLAGNADRIKNVVKLINDIATQTNLLALNATIEAGQGVRGSGAGGEGAVAQHGQGDGHDRGPGAVDLVGDGAHGEGDFADQRIDREHQRERIADCPVGGGSGEGDPRDRRADEFGFCDAAGRLSC